MHDRNRTPKGQLAKAPSDYEKGVREGFDQAMWTIIAIGVFIATVIYWSPA